MLPDSKALDARENYAGGASIYIDAQGPSRARERLRTGAMVSRKFLWPLNCTFTNQRTTVATEIAATPSILHSHSTGVMYLLTPVSGSSEPCGSHCFTVEEDMPSRTGERRRSFTLFVSTSFLFPNSQRVFANSRHGLDDARFDFRCELVKRNRVEVIKIRNL